MSAAAECQSQSGSAFQSTVSHGGCRSRPCSDRENQCPRRRARCLSIPPRVIDEAPTVVPQAGRVQSRALPRQGGALVVQEAQEGGGLVGREGWFRAALLVQVGHGC